MAVMEVGRNYQNALFDLGKEANIVVCLPTGSGKTFIALKLTKYFLADAIKNGKKIIFVANTVPLVHQQSKYFQEHLFLEFYNQGTDLRKVHELTGDVNVDIWDKNKWDSVINSGHVFMMTSQVLLDALSHSYIAFKQMNLLILDECHHADKDHPMNKIMEKYGAIMDNKEQENYELPRILGLTATIIKGSGAHNNKIMDEVRDIERRLRSRALTYHDYGEVLQHSTKANVELKSYCNDAINMRRYKEIVDCLTHAIDFVENCKNIAEKSPNASTVVSVEHPSLKFAGQVFNKSKSQIKEFVAAMGDVKRMYSIEEGLGAYCGRMAATVKISFLHTMAGSSKLLELIKIGTITALNRVIKHTDDVMKANSRSEQVQNFVSNKIKLLFEILFKWREENGQEELCGIVFCQERLTAQLLTWLFMDAKNSCPEKFGFITPAFVVGTSRRGKEVEQQRTTSFKQTEVIEKFHKKEVNLIFATNVLEEGLNVPTCNVIIRFDPINTYPSFVQSMGRARKRGALFCVMTRDEDYSRNLGLIRQFQSFNQNLAQHLQNQHLDINGEVEQKSEQFHEKVKEEQKSEDDYLAVDPSNPDSPKVTLSDAVQLVHRYCNLLPCSELATTLDPISWWDIVHDPVTNTPCGFKAYVQMPSNSLVEGVTVGCLKATKNEAKRAAFLEVCKKLYKRGAFDQSLFPHPKGTMATFSWRK